MKLTTIPLLAVLIAGIPAAVSAGDQPNVIMILVDDMGYSDVGCYGGEIDTPNLNQLAANGLRFTQFYNTARCWPTRAALMTGFYAQQVNRDAIPGLGGGGRGKRQVWARLLPDYLKPYGYRCYHSGKWHLDGKCLEGGFDRSFNMRNQGNFFTNKGNFIDDIPVAPGDDESEYYATDATAEHAIDCLKEHQREYSNKPFFHYIAFIAPHFPLHARPEDIAKYKDRYLDGWDEMRKARFQRQLAMGIHNTSLSKLEKNVGPPYHFPDALEKLGAGEVNRPLPWDTLTEEQKQFQATKMAIHAAMVDRVDQQIGRILDQLIQMKALDNTLIMFASDNGASAEIMVRHGGHDQSASPGSAPTYLCLGPGFSSACNTPFRRHKTWVHEGGCATPLIVSWPDGIRNKGAIRTTPGHVIDILPTILEATGIEKPTEWDGNPIPEAPGKSLLPAFNRNIEIKRDFLWWMHDGHRAVRVGDWKLVAAKNDSWELYNLKHDRAEQVNLALKNPKKRDQLKSIWESQLESMSQLVRDSRESK